MICFELFLGEILHKDIFLRSAYYPVWGIIASSFIALKIFTPFFLNWLERERERDLKLCHCESYLEYIEYGNPIFKPQFEQFPGQHYF